MRITGRARDEIQKALYPLHLLDARVHDDTDRDEFTGKMKGDSKGGTTTGIENELLAGIQSTDYKYNMPDSLDNLYVSDITSELLTKFDKNVPLEFQKSRIVYGIQITGLAKLVFEKRK